MPNVPAVRRLYFMLVDILLKEQPHCCSNSESTSKEKHCKDGQRARYLHAFCDSIYEELPERMNVLLFPEISTLQIASEQLYLLLRCSLVGLSLLESNISVLMEKCKLLVELLRRLHQLVLIAEYVREAPCFETSEASAMVSVNEELYTYMHLFRMPDQILPILRSLLEVYLDELLVHRKLRQYFLLADHRSSQNRGLFVNARSGDIGNFMEICAMHFLASIYSGQSHEVFLVELLSLQGCSFGFYQLGPVASVSLLHIPMLFTAPKLLQSYLISSVSEAVGIVYGSSNQKTNSGIIPCCLSAFERSVVLYHKHVSVLHPSFESPEIKHDCHLSFDSYTQPRTKNSIASVVNKLNKSWILDRFKKTKGELLESSLLFVEENKYLLDKRYKNISPVLHRIIHEASLSVPDAMVIQEENEADPHDVIHLASILKLMSRTMLQICWYLMNFESSREYNCLKDAIRCFKQFESRLPIQIFLRETMMDWIDVNSELFMMLLHFSGLTSLCFATGFDFLVNGCVLMLMGLMNLFAVEYGSFDSWRPLVSPNMELYEGRKSSLVIASKFQEIQMTFLCSKSTGRGRRRQRSQRIVGVYDTAKEKTCNGEMFLKCVVGNGRNIGDFEDLADFIECKRGKDYSAWLNNKQKYRKWKDGKLAVLRWKKKRRAWKELKLRS